MELVRGLRALREQHRGGVATLGTFDGLHLGHRALLRETLECAQHLGRSALMLSFEPMPREFLQPGDPPARLTTLRERCRLLEPAGLDALLLLRFGAALRALDGAQFIAALHEALRPACLVVGHDFHFGRGGSASAPQLEAAGRRLGFEVRIVPPVLLGTQRISSTAVRAALAAGDFRHAQSLLGRAYTMRGRVVAGERLGRRLGYPTANLRVARRRSPVQGIFAVRVHGIDATTARAGVASLGTRPTVGGGRPLLEAHVFDFQGDLYGRELEIEFVAKLREEARFETLDALVEQMHRDARAARAVLAARRLEKLQGLQ